MPIDYTLYPPNWKTFSFHIRFARAKGRCECTGQCGMHSPNPHPRRCTERHAQPAHWARGKVTLTTAHLCQCSPPCAIAAHVIATCQRCHLRIDRKTHAAHRRATLHANKQKPLTPSTPSPTIQKGQNTPRP